MQTTRERVTLQLEGTLAQLRSGTGHKAEEDAKLMIVLGRCSSLNKIILVGDPKQLQPYVSESVRKLNYGRSTMERVMDGSSTVDSSKQVYHVMLEEVS